MSVVKVNVMELLDQLETSLRTAQDALLHAQTEADAAYSRGYRDALKAAGARNLAALLLSWYDEGHPSRLKL